MGGRVEEVQKCVNPSPSSAVVVGLGCAISLSYIHVSWSSAKSGITNMYIRCPMEEQGHFFTFEMGQIA